MTDRERYERLAAAVRTEVARTQRLSNGVLERYWIEALLDELEKDDDLQMGMDSTLPTGDEGESPSPPQEAQTPQEQVTDLREQLASYAHDAWSGWMHYMMGKSYRKSDGTWTIPKEYVERWGRQMTTAYENLPEKEKDRDREQADRILALLNGDGE